MNKIFLHNYGFLLIIGLFVMPGYGQKNLPKILKKIPSSNAVFQAALHHAQQARLLAVQRATIQQATDQIPNQMEQVVKQAPRRRNVPNAPGQSPQYWLNQLEQFIQQQGHFPRLNKDESESKLYQGVYGAIHRCGEDNAISQRIRQLRAQYPRKPRGNPPAFWLEKLETFVQENNFFPRESSPKEEEKKLYQAISSIMSRLEADDPIVQRIRQLRAQYPHTLRGNPPAFWLEKLETFVQENKFFPRVSSSKEEEKKLYWTISSIMSRLEADDPIVQRILELHTQYKQPLKQSKKI